MLWKEQKIFFLLIQINTHREYPSNKYLLTFRWPSPQYIYRQNNWFQRDSTKRPVTLNIDICFCLSLTFRISAGRHVPSTKSGTKKTISLVRFRNLMFHASYDNRVYQNRTGNREARNLAGFSRENNRRTIGWMCKIFLAGDIALLIFFMTSVLFMTVGKGKERIEVKDVKNNKYFFNWYYIVFSLSLTLIVFVNWNKLIAFMKIWGFSKDISKSWENVYLLI